MLSHDRMKNCPLNNQRKLNKVSSRKLLKGFQMSRHQSDQYIKEKYFSGYRYNKNSRWAKGTYEVWTDGACNPPRVGVGGWAYVVIHPDGQIDEMNGKIAETTSNRMEINALIKALKVCNETAPITVKTDSKYLICSIKEWMPRWKSNGWVAYGGDYVKNKDLFESIDCMITGKNINFEWVPSHSGIPYNERCDYLAKSALRGIKVELKKRVETIINPVSNQLDKDTFSVFTNFRERRSGI